jgi:MFS family permease
MLLVLCGAIFLDALDVSMMGVALPSIQADLGMSTSSLQWVVSAYVLGYGGFLLLGGRAADLLGRRRMFLASMAVFLLFSGLGGLVDDGSMLIASRFIKGVAAAFTAPAGFSILTSSFPEGPERNRALTIYSATGAAGFSFGLVAGGVLTEVDWRWVFFVPVVMAAIVLVSGFLFIPREERAERPRGSFDIAGAVTATAAMMLLVYSLVEAPNYGWFSARILGSFALVIALLAVFVAIERRHKEPMLRLGILRSGALFRANIGAIALVGSWIGAQFIITLYMQGMRGWSSIETGLAVFPAGLMVVVLAARIAAPLVGRFGTTPVIAAGLLSSVAGYATLLRLDETSDYATQILPALLFIGLSFALTYGPLAIAATNGTDPGEHGLVAGILNTSFQIGPALVLAITAAVNDSFAGDVNVASGVMDGFHAALYVPLLVSAMGVVVTVFGLTSLRSLFRPARSTAASGQTAAD